MSGPDEKAERSAFTLVEVLVVVAIIGILIALLLPAIQASRESARIQSCQNHLRQFGIAAQNHEATLGHYPTGGWGASWTGDPDRGFGERQPGGWVYNILPYVEQGSTLHDLGKGASAEERKEAATIAKQTTVALFHCPSRRAVKLYPNHAPYQTVNAMQPASVARMDYAINAGHRGFNTIVATGNRGGPTSYAEGDGQFNWPDTAIFTGVSYLRSEVRASQITDGTSHTYLIGEKYLDREKYETGLTLADRGYALIGFAPDTVRLTKDLPPLRDQDVADHLGFGSPHIASCHFVFCDGSVRAISYDIDADAHRRFGNREDGQAFR